VSVFLPEDIFMRNRMAIVGSVAFAGFLVSGCRDQSTISSLTGIQGSKRNVAVDAVGQRRQTIDDRYADLNRDLPGFGGMYYDSDGSLVVLLKDPQRLGTMKPELTAFLRSGTRPGRSTFANASNVARTMRAIQAKYEFRELDAWLRSYIWPLIGQHTKITMTAIDHRSNRILVGVASGADVEPTHRAIAGLPVPRSAVHVVVAAGAAFTSRMIDSTLDGPFSPVPGGVQIARSNVACTLGFNLTRWIGGEVLDTNKYFITASHCTATQGSTDGSLFLVSNQNGATAGIEVFDPAPVFHSSQVPSCPPSRTCFLTDASLLRYAQASSAQHGYVANAQVYTINLTGRLPVTDVVPVHTGQSITLIGATGGRRPGVVYLPCVNIHLFDNTSLLCMALTNYVARVGDSGGPVVELREDGSAWAVGIQSGRWAPITIDGQQMPDTMSWFTPITALLYEFYLGTSNSLYDPTVPAGTPVPPPTPEAEWIGPPPHWATISGTATAGPNMTCHWFSATDVENAQYEWIVNGNVVGTNSHVYYASSSSYTLVLHTFNSEVGADLWTTKEITVAQGTPQCYDE
jgi:hypothetical protein